MAPGVFKGGCYVFRFLRALRRLEQLEDKVVSLEKTQQQTELDYLDILAKCKRLLASAAKREARAEALNESNGAHNSDLGGTIEARFATLSATGRRAQEQIIARRRLMGVKEE